MTMRKIEAATILALFLALAPATAALAGGRRLAQAGSQAQVAVTAPDRKKLLDHLENHQQYPATRAELLASCKDLVDFSDAEKRWFAARLPEGTYRSAAAVMKTVWKQ
jgi:hypothetical protein